jgi:hypothetical protein
MKRSVRRTVKVFDQVMGVEQLIECGLFLLMALFIIGYAIFLGFRAHQLS